MATSRPLCPTISNHIPPHTYCRVTGNDLLIAHGPRMAGDGIYVLRMEDALLVKRMARTPDGRISVRSDNPAYPNYAGVAPDAITVIGRAVWVGRDL